MNWPEIFMSLKFINGSHGDADTQGPATKRKRNGNEKSTQNTNIKIRKIVILIDTPPKRETKR